MKIIICYPPLLTGKGCPTLGQNRQFQYFSEPTYIYPVVPAQAATILKHAGHDVRLLDCIAEGIDYTHFKQIIRDEKPDLIAFETKTPVIKQIWNIINDLSAAFPNEPATSPAAGGSAFGGDQRPATPNHPPATVLYGDHVTALPEESFAHSQVDYVLTGGDYDFLLLDLCQFLSQRHLSPSSQRLQPGIYYRDSNTIKNTGPFALNHDLDTLPAIDRELTHWQRYAYKNGNYKRTPGAYIMSARDCWWGKCSFCSWPQMYPRFRQRSVKNVLDEIGELTGKYGAREIMDDSGCFPVGEWLNDFCAGVIERGYDRQAYFDCNMRFGALGKEDFALMKRANFRLVLFGLESANQATLDRINKGVTVERVIEDCKAATEAGLYPHVTLMFGYPWETYEDALKTVELGRQLLKKGHAYTMQATVVIPYPGTPLFDECRKNGWLKTQDWDDYDMKQPVMASPIPDDKLMGLVQEMYKISMEPEFIMRKLGAVRDLDDLKYYARASKKVIGHLFDFSEKNGVEK